MTMTTAPGYRRAPESVPASARQTRGKTRNTGPKRQRESSQKPAPALRAGSITLLSPSPRLGSQLDHQPVEHAQRLVGVGPRLRDAAAAAEEHRPALDHLLEDRPRRAEPTVLVDGTPDLRLGQPA